MTPSLFEKQQDGLHAASLRQAAVYGKAVAEEMWSHGFLPDKSHLYAIDQFGPDAYLSDLQRWMTQLNGPYRPILDNKAVFDALYSRAVPVVRVLGHTVRGDLKGALPHSGEIFAKPLVGNHGSGVFRAKLDGDRVTVGEETSTREEFLADLASRSRDRVYIVTPAMPQHAEMAELFGRTVNTIRVMMLRPPEGGPGFVAGTALRVGAVASGQVDAYGRGGVCFAVDLESGEIGRGWKHRGARPADRVESHPDTGQSITGRRIPMWEQVLQTCQMAFEHCPGLNYVGWDIIVTPTGPVVLEGNNNPDVNFLQMHRPLLVDERVRAFYAHHGVLDVHPTRPLYEPVSASAA